MKSQTPKEVARTLADHAETAVSAVLQTLPFTGGLACYLAEYFPGQQRRILQDLVDSLRNHAGGIDAVRCDLDALAALVHKTIFESLQTASARKREAFRSILLNFAAGKTSHEHELDLFIQLVSRLTDLQIRMLDVAVDPEKSARELNLIPSGAVTYGDIAVEQVIPSSTVALSRIAFRELKNLGLLDPKSDMFSGSNLPVNISLLCLSELGARFLDWIKT